MITNADITIYIKSTNKDGNTWQKNHIYDVSWQETRKVAVGNNGLITADSVTVFIPFKSAKGLVIKKGDVICRGIIDFEIDETNKEKNVKALRQKYNEAMTAISVSKRDYGSPNMQHWEVILG